MRQLRAHLSQESLQQTRHGGALHPTRAARIPNALLRRLLLLLLLHLLLLAASKGGEARHRRLAHRATLSLDGVGCWCLGETGRCCCCCCG